MNRTIKRIDVENALEAADIYDHEESIRTDYKGRGYVTEGFGITLNSPLSLFSFFAALGMVAGENYADDVEDGLEDGTVYDLASSAQSDSMGRGSIVYFPGWTLSE